MKTNKMSKSLLSMLMALVMVLGMVPAMAFAAEDTGVDRKGTATATMMHESQDKPSMCDVMFAEKTDIEVTGDTATLKIYVAYPVPAFPTMGKDGTVKDFKVTYNGETYTATSDIDSKPQMTVKDTNLGFGLKKGDQIQAQVLTLTLPKAALEESELPTTAFVNVIMGLNVKFRLSLTDFAWEEVAPQPDPQPEPETPADKLGTITATMMQETQDQPSMCDVMFAEKADVALHGDKVTLKFYVAFPVPAFPDMGTDGTLKDFKVTYNGETYTATSDIDSKPLMTVKADNPGFGLKKGDQIPSQVLTLTLPKAALEESMLPTTAFVNVVMGMNVNFRMALSDLVWDETKPEPQPEPQPQPEDPAMDFVDEATGIKVHADKNVFTEKVTLVVTPIAQGENGYDAAAKILESVGKKFQLFDIHFVNENGEEVQPNGKVTVSYPIPADYDAAKLAVYRINEDGTKTKINGSVEDHYLTVVQKSFSTYALVEEGSTAPDTVPGTPDTTPAAPSAPQTGDTTAMTALVSLLLVTGAAMAVLVLGKKRSSVK